MKKILCCALLALSINALSAQTEIKVSPIGLIFEVAAISVETAINPSFSLDGDAIIAADYFGFNLSGKYYFNPKAGIDGFHIGAFAGNAISDEAIGIGFLTGYKIMSRKRITFEFGLGLGRSFDSGIVGYAKVHLGYRFGKKTAN